MNGQCVNTCPINYEASISLINGTYSGQCIVCPTNCSYCNSGKCIVCINTTVLFNGTCVTSCPISTYLSIDQCLKCP